MHRDPTSEAAVDAVCLYLTQQMQRELVDALLSPGVVYEDPPVPKWYSDALHRTWVQACENILRKVGAWPLPQPEGNLSIVALACSNVLIVSGHRWIWNTNPLTYQEWFV